MRGVEHLLGRAHQHEVVDRRLRRPAVAGMLGVQHLARWADQDVVVGGARRRGAPSVTGVPRIEHLLDRTAEDEVVVDLVVDRGVAGLAGTAGRDDQQQQSGEQVAVGLRLLLCLLDNVAWTGSSRLNVRQPRPLQPPRHRAGRRRRSRLGSSQVPGGGAYRLILVTNMSFPPAIFFWPALRVGNFDEEVAPVA